MDAVYEALRAGDCALVHTDTVYGLAALPATPGEDKIYALKGRPADQMLPWLVSGEDMLRSLAASVRPYALRLARMFWPGALTLVVSDGAATRALRCPDSAVCLELIDRLGQPLACTSANVHGQKTPLCKEQLPHVFKNVAGYDELPGTCGALASTIVDCTGEIPRVLREGAIPAHVVWDVAVFDDTLAE